MSQKRTKVRSLSNQGWPSKGIWAVAARDGDEYGVACGQGDQIVGFIPESRLHESLQYIQRENSEQASLLADAVKDLSRLKGEIDQRQANHLNG